MAAWVQSLDEAGIRALWMRRYAGDDMAGRLFKTLDIEKFRAFLVRPFDFQPADDGVLHFRPVKPHPLTAPLPPRRSSPRRRC